MVIYHELNYLYWLKKKEVYVILIVLPLYVLRYPSLAWEFIDGGGTEYKVHSDSPGFDLSNSLECTSVLQQLNMETL